MGQLPIGPTDDERGRRVHIRRLVGLDQLLDVVQLDRRGGPQRQRALQQRQRLPRQPLQPKASCPVCRRTMAGAL